MPKYGLTLLCEVHGPNELLDQAHKAEETGFDFLVISDHFHPWLPEHEHSPFAWSVLGAVAAQTSRVELATMVTCPFVRYHPAVIAQAAATVALLSDGRRFQLGLGSGERLNEHVIGCGWPSVDVRQERLGEAVRIIQRLFGGETCSFRGEHLRLDDARLFDRPSDAPQILLAAGGPHSAKLAGETADGLIATEAKSEIVEAYQRAGGDGPRMAEIGVCWAKSAKAAQETIHHFARWNALGWEVLPELPTPKSFAAVTSGLDPEQVSEEVPHGPDAETFVKGVRKFAKAGFDEIVLHQIGPDQDGFIRFFERELLPALG